MGLCDFKGKGAIVTGAASGIGLGIARMLGRAGANVVLVDVDEAGLAQAREAVASYGVRAYAKRLDVSDRDAMRQSAPEIEALLGRVHVVVNNAGVETSVCRIEELADREWDWIVGVNLSGVLHGIRFFVPLLRKHDEGGHVVNTASIAGFQVSRQFRYGAYAMTKAAVVAITEALEMDMEGSNIGVSLLCPGTVKTRIFDSARNRPTRFGGADIQRKNEKLEAALADGITPDQVGERVLRGIRDGEFYLFTHDYPRPRFEARFRRILEAFDRIAEKPQGGQA